MGFPKWKCPACSKSILRPLTSLRRSIYWVLLALFGGMYVVGLIAGMRGIPGIPTLLLIVALFKDYGLQRKQELGITAPIEGN